MFIRKKKYQSGHIGIIVTEKISGKMKELATISIARSPEEVSSLTAKAREWIDGADLILDRVLDSSDCCRTISSAGGTNPLETPERIFS